MILRLYSGFLAVIFLCGCASLTTTTLKPTDTTRDATTAEKSAATRFQTRRQPSTENPNLEIAVKRQITREESFQRRYIEKRVLKSGARAVLWLGGAAIAGGGYYVMTETGWVMLGKDFIGLGALLPLASELVVAGMEPVGEEWKQESRTFPARTITARNTDIIASVGSSSWTIQTDDDGKLVVDASNLVDMVASGQPLTIDFALQQDPS